MASCTLRRLPVLVVVLGPTGAGKSKLAIEIGARMNGEIISADSMQIYKGLDIITNKVTPEEQRLCKHHMIDMLSPSIETQTVVHFRNEAIPIIDDIMRRKKLPIIVGGTNYYIESLLWKNLVSQQADMEKPDYSHQSNQELHQALKALDPDRASQLHPNDRRKVARSLQVYQQRGILHSTLLEQQHCSGEGSSVLGGPLRYKDTCIFWLTSDVQVLDERLDKRVDDMMERGLVDELIQFHKEFNASRVNRRHPQSSTDQDPYTFGIFQSIGFKEFHPYLVLPEEEKGSQAGRELLSQGLASLKLATRRYARRQNRWVRNRFLKRPGSNVPAVYGLDSTLVEEWNTQVLEPALEILTRILNGEEPSIPPLEHEARPNVNNRSHFCEICNKLLVCSDVQWEVHLKSWKHHRAVVKSRKRASPCLHPPQNEFRFSEN